MSEQTGPDRISEISSDLEHITEDLEAARGFVGLIRTLEKLSDMAEHVYDRTQNRYCAVSSGRPVSELELLLEDFFGSPKKRSENPMPAKLHSHPILGYLEGDIEGQSLFFRKTENGLFYGALETLTEPFGQVAVRLGFARKKSRGKKAPAAGLEIGDIGLPAQSLEERIAEQLNEGSGRIDGVGLATFLLESEAEKSSCSLRVTTEDLSGYLFIKNGVLIDASCGKAAGIEAAMEIISWVDTQIVLENPVERDEDTIAQPLLRTFTGALKKRNSRNQESGQEVVDTPPSAAKAAAAPLKKGPAKKKKRPGKAKIRPVYAVILAVVVMAAGAVYGYRYWQEQKRQEVYAVMAAAAAAEKDTEQAVSMLEAFIQAGPHDEYARKASEDILRLKTEAEKRFYDQIEAEVEALLTSAGFETKAEQIYQLYLERYPQGRYAQNVRERIGSLGELAEKSLYQQVVGSKNEKPAAKIAAYQRYIERFPEGRHRKDVEKRIDSLAADQFRELETAMLNCKRSGRWQDCVDRCDGFLSAFGISSFSAAVRDFRKEAQGNLDLVEVDALAAGLAGDPQKAKLALEQFLQKRSDSPAAGEAQKRLAEADRRIDAAHQWQRIESLGRDEARPLRDRVEAVRSYAAKTPFTRYRESAARLAAELEKRMWEESQKQQQMAAEQYRRMQLERQKQQAARERMRIEGLEKEAEVKLAAAGERFVAGNAGTFVDKKSGLIWCLLDSQKTLNHCQSYQEAKNYVAKLSTGNFTDWRLPTAGELASLYKNPPFFPVDSAPWYWTTKIFTTGYHTKVRVVSSDRETEFKTEYRRASECGAVRAVRDPS
ncbi:MAG: DUF1566 domain-containing protein [Desulfobacterales bacterium]|nr:DUF1566 domain-containing protein [Desulfobacterales bacterium]